ncbi:S8 family peptidase [Quadrisphaera sp. GCM10027208]|uniref:S8 family peptidase n=1 Tax=Quadrisphaera sp. GCM10027208 TaxID=3273423 RepID=UPI00360A83E3
MSSSRWARARKRSLAAVAGAGMVAATLSTAGAATAAPPQPTDDRLEAPASTTDFKTGRYVVVMKDRPVIGYQGGIPGYEATKPAAGEKLDADSPAANRYRGLLKANQDKALQRAGGPAVLYRYTNAISGFAADLTGEQAEALAKDPGVLSVSENELMQPDTSISPDFLGLTGEEGTWAKLGGTSDLKKGAGSGVIVGVVDTGIRPENPSFADNGMPRPKGWSGECETGPDFPASSCTNKLVGARYYVDGFGTARLAEYENMSPLDNDGHGSHTAGTAAGNYGVEAVIPGVATETISGMAPAAHVAAYKVCWDDNSGGGGCATADSVAAIDQAVADGVDVLNFSISGTTSNYLAPVELAFMFAADAGVFVAASSGNSGPGASTTNHPSPWLTTVAASTHAIREQTLVTGDGSRYIGASITEPLETSTPMVLAEDIPAEGATSEDAALCFPGTLDPTAAADKIVVCDRGVSARVEKSAVVADAGGVGMVLVNVTEGSLDTDLHSVPTVHLSHEYRDALRAYVRDAESPTGQILPTNEGTTTQVPEVAGFSSRGPSLGAGGDILKPDISAPGVGVLAAYSPRSEGRNFDFLSGTSMSSPHIAGLAALVKQANPKWSPMEIKSAMMTTARDHASEASNDLFASGAGFVEPRRFLNPGLVYDTDQSDWWDFLAGQGVTYSDGTPVSDNPIDASDLNQASIAIGSLAGSQTVTRTVTNVAPKGKGGLATYTAKVSGMDGIDVTVTPSTLQLRPGESADFTVTFRTDGAALNQYAKGYLTWTGATGDVRSPIAVRPVAAATPGSVNVPVDADTVDLEVTPGYTGTLTTQVLGLAAGSVTEGTALNTSGADFDPTDERNHHQDLSVPAGTFATRIELQANDPQNDDLDMFVERKSDGVIVAAAATGAANEVATVTLPEGEYTLHVQAWAVADAAESTTFGIRTFNVPTTDNGTLVFDPATQNVTQGVPTTFSGTLNTDRTTPYFGFVVFRDGNGAQAGGLTFVSVG